MMLNRTFFPNTEHKYLAKYRVLCFATEGHVHRQRISMSSGNFIAEGTRLPVRPYHIPHEGNSLWRVREVR